MRIKRLVYEYFVNYKKVLDNLLNLCYNINTEQQSTSL